MKYITALLAAAVAGVVAHEGHAHTLGDYVPECSLQCLNDARKNATTCKDDTDLECFCILENYRAIYDASVACVLAACGQDVAVAEVLPAVVSMCEEVSPLTTTIGGGTLQIPTGSASTDGPAPATTGSADSTETDAPASAETTSGSGAAGLAAGLVGAAVPLAMAALL